MFIDVKQLDAVALTSSVASLCGSVMMFGFDIKPFQILVLHTCNSGFLFCADLFTSSAGLWLAHQVSLLNAGKFFFGVPVNFCSMHCIALHYVTNLTHFFICFLTSHVFLFFFERTHRGKSPWECSAIYLNIIELIQDGSS